MEYKLNEMQDKVFLDRYALKDEKGNPIETNIEETWQRIAKDISSVECDVKYNNEYWYREFYKALYDFQMIPGGRIISGAGSDNVTFFNCYVIPSPEDSRLGIMESITLMIEIMSRGGGVGVNLSTLRPNGAYVKGVNGHSSGIISWGELYSQATGSVCQGGSRRGALLIGLEVDHPDIEEFITAKKDFNKLTNANLSVLITDDFMKAVKNNEKWDLKFDGKIYKTVEANHIWDLICESAWRSGEPGLIFLDRYNKQSNSWYFDKIICCNPCGEQGLPAMGVCNLGGINLSKIVDKNGIDYIKLKNLIHTTVRFLDNVIERTPYFIVENEKAQKDSRRIGLWTIGLADALIKMGVRYGSEEAIEICDEIYKYIAITAYKASINLAQEKGCFPKFQFDKFFMENEESFAYKIYKLLPEEYCEKARKYGIRNVAILTQAPTGSTGLLSNTSSGIEPNFAFEIKRKDRLGEHTIKHYLYEKWLRENDLKTGLPDFFVTAQELTPEEHIKMQAIIQKWTDSSISKTINAPNNHTIEDVKKTYSLSYDLGNKGVTYYRDGSRNEQVLTDISAEKPEQKTETEQQLKRGEIIPASRKAEGYRIQLSTGCGHLWLMVFADENGDIVETFVNTGSKGGCAVFTQATSRIISLALRGGVPIEEIIDQLDSSGSCPSYQMARGKGFKVSKGKSCPSAIAHALIEIQKELKEGIEDTKTTKTMKIIKIKEKAKEMVDKTNSKNTKDKCPECSAELIFTEGCNSCQVCGFSKCG